LKHGVLAETVTAHVHATGVIDIKALKAAITLLEQLAQCLDVNIQFAQAEYFLVVVLNVLAVEDVQVMLTDLI
jgi:hypothetical protein